MFNRLPPELVRQIVESSVPSTHHYKSYSNRQTILRTLCLVCRLFREIAQPLLFEFVCIARQSKLIALHKTLESEGCRGIVRQLIFEDEFDQYTDEYDQRLDTEDLKRILRSCQGLRSLTLHVQYSGRSDLSILQDLPYLADLSLFGPVDQFPSSFKLQALTTLSIDYSAMEVAPDLLNPEVLPSLRSLAIFNIYNDGEIAHLNRSRLDQLVPQLELLFLNAYIIQRGLDYLIPALSRTLFEFYPPSADDQIDQLQVAQHLRLHKCLTKEVVQEFVVSIANQNRQISLRSLYLDISLEDLSSLPVDLVKAAQVLLRVCKEKRIEVIYEDQEVGFAEELRPSEDFCRRQREVRKLEATSE